MSLLEYVVAPIIVPVHFLTLDLQIMGVGPAYAIPKILNKAGIKIEDVDLFEINEAFAGQALMCVDSLKVDPRKLNPNGGAIALGHPLGTCTNHQDLS